MPSMEEIMVREMADQKDADKAARRQSRAGLVNAQKNWLIKAVSSASRGENPAWTHHEMGEAQRRLSLVQNGIYEDLTARTSPVMLRHLGREAPILRAIIGTRKIQVAAHYGIPATEKSIGFRVVQKERDRPLTPATTKRAKEIESICRLGGVVSANRETGQMAVWDGHGERKAVCLTDIVKMIVEETLTLDRVFLTIEGSTPISGQIKNPVMFWTIEDGALMRMADRKRYSPKLRPELANKTEYVMLDPMLPWGVQREYAHGEGAMWIRNRRVEQASFGYGYPEVEQAVNAILGIQYATSTNRKWFTDSHIPAGILTLIGDFGEEQIEDLRAEMQQEVTLENPFKFPIIQAPAGQGVNTVWNPLIDRTKLDMVFRAYAEWCVAEACSVFLMAPEEINFMSFGRGNAVLSESNPESIVVNSQSRGLLPLVLESCAFISQAIVERIDPDFEAQIQGLDARYNPELIQMEQLDLARMEKGLTLNQVRALNDQDPIYDPLDLELWTQVERAYQGKVFPVERMRQQAIIAEYEAAGGRRGSYPDAPVNPTLNQIWVQEHMAEQQAAQEQMGQVADQETQGQREEDRATGQNMQEVANRRDQDGADGGEPVRVPQAEDAYLRKSLSPRVIVIKPRGDKDV